MLNPKPVYDEESIIDWDMFCAMVPDGQKADLIDGVIYMASPDSRRANRVNAFLLTLMEMYVQRRKLGGEVYVSRFAYRMSDHNAPEPDVGYVCEERLKLMEEGGMRGAPDIAVEIVAKESHERDWVTKRELYEKFGVREYWIIDYLQKKFEFLKLVGNRFVPMKLEDDHIFRSQVLPGFWLDIEWLLAKPLPSTPDCLDQILKG